MSGRPPGPTRVVFVVNDLRRAGAETQLVMLALGLPRERYDPSIVLLKTENQFAAELRAGGLPVVALGQRSPGDVLVLWRLRQALSARRPDVVHGFLSFANLLTVVAGRLAGAGRIVVSQRSSYEATLSPFWRRAARLAHRFADKVIVNSRSALEEERAVGLPDALLVHVPNGVRLDESPVVDRGALGLPAGPLVLALGQLSAEKGHADLLRAFALVRASHPDAHLAFVGDGPLRAALEELAGRLGVEPAVRFLGFRSPSAPYLAAADVVAQPSLTEGLPNAVLEAMAQRRPVVATRVGGVPELVVDGETGLLVPPRQPPALAAAIGELLGNPEKRQAMGAAARRRAEESFSEARMLERTQQLYASLLGTEARGSS